jgi:hypothetical protein
MNNQDLFREWYISQINPRTGRNYCEGSATTYITYINRLVRNGLVGENIFDLDADEFRRLIEKVQKYSMEEFDALDHHGNLTNGIEWWKRFLDAQSEK